MSNRKIEVMVAHVKEVRDDKNYKVTCVDNKGNSYARYYYGGRIPTNGDIIEINV